MKKSLSKTWQSKAVSSANKLLQLKDEKRETYLPSNEAPKLDLTGNPLEKYRCNQCGDTFLFESSLIDHQSRRSMNISFNCSLCKKVITVHNRCAFLSHSLSHPNVAEVSEVNISPLSISNASSADPSFSNAFPKEVKRVTTDGKCTQKSNCVASTSFDENKKKGSNKCEQDKDLKCFECGHLFGNSKQRQDHYDSIVAGMAIQCEVCMLWCPNACSFKAHKRLHTSSQPYVCPECGEDFCSLHSLAVHTIMRCQHLFRHIVYSCPFCCLIVKSLNVLIEHIADHHTQVSFQCTLCLFKYDSDSSFETHKKAVHSDEPDVRQTKLYKCQQCTIELSSRMFYFTHVENHVRDAKNVTKFQFSCPQCDDRLCASKNQLLVHLKAAHLLDLKNSFKAKEHLVNTMTKEMCLRYKISFDGKESLDNDVCVENKCEIRDKHLLRCEACEKTATTREELFNHGKSEHTSKGLFVCLVCFNKTMGSEEALLKHLNLLHSKELKCPLNTCTGLKFGGAYTVLDHFIEKHGLINRLDDWNEMNNDCREEPVVKRMRGVNAKLISPINGNSPHKNGTNGFQRSLSCGICGYDFLEENQFRVHMNVHKNDKAPFLCYECGSSFVAAPSFKRHLQSEHKIENGNEYIAKYLPELYETVSEKQVDVIGIIHDETLTESICPVCKTVCANSTDLKTHVRVHGMAFIKSCQKNNSLHFDSYSQSTI